MTVADIDRIKQLAAAEARCASSLVEFRKRYLSAPGDVAPAPFHEEWSQMLLYGREHYAIKGFRSSAKDQYVQQAFPMFCLTYPCYERSYIVIICATSTLAEEKLRFVTSRFQSPECENLRIGVKTIVKDAANAFEVLYRDGMRVRIEAYGKGASIRGLNWGAKRPDIIILNDPQDLADMYSPAVLAKDWQWFVSDVIFLGNATRIFIIGNDLGALCIINRCFDKARELGFVCRRYPALDENGQSTWPAKEPTEKIVAERESFRAIGEIDTWTREKMCLVMAAESRPLKPEQFGYYDPYTYDLSGCIVKVVLDPAISEKKDADESPILAAAIRDDGHYDLLDFDVDRRNPYKIVDALFRAVARWNPKLVGVETIAYQEMLAQEIERQQIKRGVYFPIVRIRGARGRAKLSKEQKIRMRLQPKMAVGAIRLPKGAPWVQKLIDQTREFPYGAHDDMIDCIAMLDDVTADLLIANYDQYACQAAEFPLPRNWPTWAALVADPQGEAVVLLLTCSPEGRLYVVDQIFFRGTPEALYQKYKAMTGSRAPLMITAPATMFRENKASVEVWADSYTAAGFRLIDSDDDYANMITNLNQAFAAPYEGSPPKLQIFPRCKRLMWELYHAVAGEQDDADRKSIQALMLLLSLGPAWRDMQNNPAGRSRVINYPPRDVP